ncbi:hypothetical protein D1632_07440 [Chryseobacterium nematophagum]|uniref:YcxB family protein n=1 Tax=Chryseobacterium nematophagum TaxID=2305228 RepID=A0A3M7LDB6_9FLAO|nr:hypothetical protein [Chryseobacterium nematophagum]RMZ59466.1 hypothetical protein D1632_07440 [Chryseobacterium nematophagum]
MNEEKTIILQAARTDFEEIYFNENQGNLLFSPMTKGKTIITIITAIILFTTFLLKENLSEDNVGILYFLSFIFLLCAIFLSVSVNRVSRWKKQVNNYLSSLEDCNVYEIRFDHHFFTVNIDNEKETSEWTDFETFDINEKFISLEGKYSYMFPKKAMNEKAFVLLEKTIKDNIKI